MKRRHFHFWIFSLTAILTKQMLGSHSALAISSRYEAVQLLIEGQKHIQRQEWAEAIEKLATALAFYRRESHYLSVAMTQMWLGMAYGGAQNFPRAEANLETAADWFLKNEHSTFAGMVLLVLGRTYEGQGKILRAIATYERAIAFGDRILLGIRVPTLQDALVKLQGNVYPRLIGLYRLRQNFEKVLEHIEQAKARAFLDRLARGSIDFYSGNDGAILAEIDEVVNQLAALRQQRISTYENYFEQIDNFSLQDELAAIEEKIRHYEAEFSRHFESLQIRSPELADLQRMNVSTLSEIRQALETDTTLINYFAARETIFAVIIAPTELKAIAIPVSPMQLVETLAALGQDWQGQNPPPASAHPPLLQKLYDILIAPLRNFLNTPTLGISPHGVLHYVPFAALTNGQRYLCEDYALFSLPSASILRLLPQTQEKQRTGKILLMGNPTINAPDLSNLPYARIEVEAIAEQWDTTAYTGEQATESLFWQQAPTAELIHLAAHGRFNQEQPFFSTLYLARSPEFDGELQVRELFPLNLKAARLVVLSACETQMAKLNPARATETIGDEIVALNRSFLFAGAPTTIATLRAVSDRLTQELMVVFYNQLKQEVPKAEALRQAMVDSQKTKLFSISMGHLCPHWRLASLLILLTKLLSCL
jgi:CHAT domain-containing protein